jgi:asparagine synthase (glutamine-hydrolysing)
MCGLFGLVTPGKPVDSYSCLLAIESLQHRGPDGLGVAQGSTRTGGVRLHFAPLVPADLEPRAGEERADLFLGHQRLAIVDLSSSASQPMTNEDGMVWVVFNGEIYNHEPLRRCLVSRGHSFQTDHSDTEVLVHGYEEWGDDVVKRLRGMFAFAVLDLRRGRLLLARDRFGEKPLYFCPVDGGIAFASELKALLAGGLVERIISRPALVDYLRFGYVPAPSSIYRHVSKLAAAEIGACEFSEPSEVRTTKYWTLRYEPSEVRDDASWYHEFESRTFEAVRLRLMSDVPIGAFLSGGLDSSMVVREMRRAVDSTIQTFSISFRESDFDESPYATHVSQTYGSQHQTELLSVDALTEWLPKMARIFDEPFADSSALPTLALVNMARRSVTTCLSGDGGDELLAGYDRYTANLRLSRVFDNTVGAASSVLVQLLARAWPEHIRGKGFVKILHSGELQRYAGLLADSWLAEQSHLELKATDGGFEVSGVWDSDAAHLVDRMCKADISLYVPEDLMVKVDRTSMSASLESRAPFLDHELFEFIARSPLRLRYDTWSGEGKIPFRRLLGADLGSAHVNRRKHGFRVPLGRWFRTMLRELVHDAIGSRRSFIAQLFPERFASRLLTAHTKGTRDQSHRLWQLLALELWHREYGGGIE